MVENVGHRARNRYNPVRYAPTSDVLKALGSLRTLDRDHWAESFISAAEPYEAAALEAHAKGDSEAEVANRLIAYDLLHIGRYPAPNSPLKSRAYDLCRTHLEAAMTLTDPTFRRVEIPAHGGNGAPCVIPVLVRTPELRSEKPFPVVLTWGGIDSFKEERIIAAEPFLQLGAAVVALDMPGAGEAPIKGASDAETLFRFVLDWIEVQADLDAARVVAIGLSTGGYWAAKIAHLYPERLLGAVSHGGCAHYAFERTWIEQAQDGEYPLELAETLAFTWGMSTMADWIDIAPALSLLGQGVLEQPGAPMLLLNGVNDTVFPIQDMHLLLQHGRPKAARFFDAGHMGRFDQAIIFTQEWLKSRLMHPAGL